MTISGTFAGAGFARPGQRARQGLQELQPRPVRFMAGGATGTLTARVQDTDKHHRLFAPCLSGTQTWSATP
jgi:ABC-type uncharacterized transport system permease subunit